MENIISIFVFCICCILLIPKKRCIYLLSFFLSVRILVPETTRFFGSAISVNTFVIIIIFISLLFNKKIIISYKDKKFINIIFIYIVYCLIVLPLSDMGNFKAQLGNLFEYIVTQCLPAIAALFIIKSYKDLNIFNKSFLTASAIACLYGLLTFVFKSNPYVELLTGKVVEMSQWKGYATFATFTSTTTFGYFLTLGIPYTIYIFHNDKCIRKKYIIFTLVLMLVSVILCKKRSAMVSIISMGIIYFLMYPKTKKYYINLFMAVLAMISLILIIRMLPGLEKLNNFITASIFFWNDKAVNVTSGELGSTMELRIRQLFYPFIEIKNNYLFGHGFGWCSWYIDEYLLHPILYGFESIFATSICEMGIMGFVVIPALFYRIYLNFIKEYKGNSNKSKINIGLLFLLTYIIDIIASGMNYFYLFLLLIVAISKMKECGYEK